MEMANQTEKMHDKDIKFKEKELKVKEKIETKAVLSLYALAFCAIKFHSG